MGLEILTFGTSLSVLIKFLLDHRVGASRYCSDGSFTSFVNFRYAEEGFAHRITARTYRLAYRLKWIGLLLLPLGGWPTVIGAIITALWFFAVEIHFDYKHHTIFLGLCCSITALAGPGGIWAPAVTSAGEIETVRLLALVLLTQMYLSSGLIKMLSPSFMSGQVLENLFDYLSVEQQRFRWREVRIPRLATRLLAGPEGNALTRTMSRTTVACEIALAPLLWIPGAWPVAFTLGAAMHCAFQIIPPLRLLPFLTSILTLYLVVRG